VRKTKEAAENSRKMILEAAADGFLRKGYASTTMEEIGKAVGMSKGAVFWHFASKAGVLKAMADMVIARLEEEMGKTLEMSIPIMSKFRKLLIFIQKDRFFPILAIFGKATPTNGVPHELYGEVNGRLNQLITEAMRITEAAKDNGELRADTNTADIMALIIAVVYGFLAPEAMPEVINRSVKGANREGVINILFEGLLSYQKK
jgi:AcrR family transcriptional regulator